MRFLGGIFNDGGALGEHGGHHNVHRCTDGDHVEIDVRALHAPAVGLGADKVALAYLSAHGNKTLDVLVNRANAAKVAAAGHGDLRLAEATEQRANEIVGGADLVGKLLRDLRGGNVAAVDLDAAAVEKTDIRAELLQNLEQRGHVGDLRNIFNAADAVDQKSSGNDGDRGIFCAADAHFTKERVTALNDVFRHKNSLAREGETSIYNLEKQQEKNRLFMVFT